MKLKKFTTIFVLFALLVPFFSHAEKIGWVTDIHAGSERRMRKSATNIFYPRLYESYLEQALLEMESDGVKLVVFSGDIINHSRQAKYAKRIRAMVREAGMEMVWAKGNHDSGEVVEKYMKREKSYYFVDRFGWRIIAIDNSERLSVKEGGMRSQQQNWLEKLLEDTNRPVLAVMHFPIFDQKNYSVHKIYRETEKWFSEDEKVKLVLSGHWHAQYSTTLNKVRYMVGNPLTLESRMGSYYIVDLDTLQIEARQAVAVEALRK